MAISDMAGAAPTPDVAERLQRPVEASAAPRSSAAPQSAPEAATEELSQREDAIPANAIQHPACGQWRTGLSRSHCPACCRTFSTDSVANKHRVGKHGTDRRCVAPAEVGLVAREKPYGVLWSSPAPEGGYAFHAAPQERPDAAEHEAAVTAWNAQHPVGTPVVAYPGARPEHDRNATRIVTKTRSAAEVLGGHTPVVWVEGHEACIALTHVDTVTEGETHERP
jgi:hypothetical protein